MTRKLHPRISRATDSLVLEMAGHGRCRRPWTSLATTATKGRSIAFNGLSPAAFDVMTTEQCMKAEAIGTFRSVVLIMELPTTRKVNTGLSIATMPTSELSSNSKNVLTHQSMTHLIHRHPPLHLVPKKEMNPLTTPHPMTNRTRPRTVAPNDQLDCHDRCNWLFDIQKIYLEPVGFEPRKTMSRLHYRQFISGKSSVHSLSDAVSESHQFRFLSFFKFTCRPFFLRYSSLLFPFLVVACTSCLRSC